MKDVFGNDLEIGDTVAYMEPGYAYALKKGKITKFTPQKLVIDGHQYKFPKQVAKKVEV